MTTGPLDASRSTTASPRRGWRPGGAALISLAASTTLLVVLYRSLDARGVAMALARAQPGWLAVSVGMILPITFLRAVRFFWVAPSGALPNIAEALRLTLVSSALNVFVPGKAGDLAKSYFVARERRASPGVSVAIVVYERLCDLCGLITWCVLGWLLSPPLGSRLPAAFWIVLGLVAVTCGALTLWERSGSILRTVVHAVMPRRVPPRVAALVDGWPDLMQLLAGRRLPIVGFSLLLWLTHLLQLWLFTRTLSATVPFWASAALSAVALMAGQLPLTVAGLGARDVALVVLLGRYMSPESAAAMGILTATRNLLPPLLGAPLMGPYLSSAARDIREWRSAKGSGA